MTLYNASRDARYFILSGLIVLAVFHLATFPWPFYSDKIVSAASGDGFELRSSFRFISHKSTAGSSPDNSRLHDITGVPMGGVNDLKIQGFNVWVVSQP